jgi:hypothetical protein
MSLGQNTNPLTHERERLIPQSETGSYQASPNLQDYKENARDKDRLAGSSVCVKKGKARANRELSELTSTALPKSQGDKATLDNRVTKSKAKAKRGDGQQFNSLVTHDDTQLDLNSIELKKLKTASILQALQTNAIEKNNSQPRTGWSGTSRLHDVYSSDLKDANDFIHSVMGNDNTNMCDQEPVSQQVRSEEEEKYELMTTIVAEQLSNNDDHMLEDIIVNAIVRLYPFRKRTNISSNVDQTTAANHLSILCDKGKLMRADGVIYAI